MSLPERPPGPASAAATTVTRSLSAFCGAVLAVALAGCVRGGPPPGEPAPDPERGERPPPEAPETEAPSRERIEEASRLLDRGRAERAFLLADSLHFRFRASGDRDGAARSLELAARARLARGDTAGAAELLGELTTALGDTRPAREAIVSLASLRVSLGDDPAAVAVLLEHPDAWDRRARPVLERASGHLSVGELDALLEDAPAAAPGEALSLLREARETARSEARRSSTVRIGLLIPSSGRLESVGRWLREGISLALASPPEGAPDVELVPVDLAGGGSVREKVDRLLNSDVAAIIGPVRSDELAAASEAAGHRLVVSPTANAGPVGPRPGYALWDRDRRELDAASALGRWLGRAVRPLGVGVLYPRTEMGRRSYLAFRRGLGASGGGIGAAVAFDAEATTVEEPIRRIGAHAPPVVFAPAPGSGSILQLAPQLSYYGIRGAVVAGGPDWSSPSTFRRLEPSFDQFRIAPTYRDRGEGGGWARFTESYEREYRKALGENVLPGLGHDAALLLLRALADVRPARPRAVARRFAALREVAGATGPMTPDAPKGTVGRAVEVRALSDRELVPTSAAEVRAWVREASGATPPHERRRRAQALRAVRDANIRLEGEPSAGDER